MPLELIADRPGHAIMQPYQETPPGPDQVRLRSLYSAIKHGTEFRGFQANTPDATARWDSQLRLHIRGEEQQGQFPMALGDLCLGVVMDLGEKVTGFKVGDQVFAHVPVRATHTVPAQRLQIAPEGASPQALMYTNPTDVAVGGVRDAPVRLGDRVAVFGLGAIGQMAVQVARLAGATPEVRIIPFRGEYYRLRDEAATLVRSLIYPVPDPTFPFLGVHFTRRVDGTVEVGPNAVLALGREHYRGSRPNAADIVEMLRFGGCWRLVGRHWRAGGAELWRSRIRAVYARSARALVPEVSGADLLPGGAGVRAQAVGADGRLVDDFWIQESPGFVHVLNAPSPAATASLAIGDHLADLVIRRLGR